MVLKLPTLTLGHRFIFYVGKSSEELNTFGLVVMSDLHDESLKDTSELN